MEFGTSLIIFLLAIVALVAEFILYMVVFVGAAIGESDSSGMFGIVNFFVCLMVLTAATGVLSPFCALIGMAAKKPNVASYSLALFLVLITVGLIVYNTQLSSYFETLNQDRERDQEPQTDGATTDRATPAALSREITIEPKPEVEYIPSVLVRNVRVGKSVLDETGVFGEIKNVGDKTLSEVKIVIFCLDNNGQAVFEKTFHPVLVTKYSFGGDNEPLKPNYSKKFGVKLDDAPSDWGGDVRVEVSEVAFAE
jgi:hypothetical protein